MALIDYRGYRLIGIDLSLSSKWSLTTYLTNSAISILPISHDTIIYGSADGGLFIDGKKTIVSVINIITIGENVHASVEEFNDKMRRVGEILNLKPHYVAGVELFGPGDIEGHKGKDGLFYVLDFSRTFPPEAPQKPAPPPPFRDRSVFYKMLRPEFVR